MTEVSNVSEEAMAMIPGMQNFDAEDLIFPAIKLIHPTSEIEVGNPGQFYNTVTKDVMDEVELVLVTFRKEKKAWPDKKTGEMGEAKPQYIVLAKIKGTKETVMLYVGGTSFWALRSYFNQFFQAGLPLWSTSTTLTSEKKSGEMGAYYAMNFAAGEETAAEVQTEMLGFFEKEGQKAIESNEKDDREAVDGVQDVAV